MKKKTCLSFIVMPCTLDPPIGFYVIFFLLLLPCFLATPLHGAVVPQSQSSVLRHTKLHERIIYGTFPGRMYTQVYRIWMQGLNLSFFVIFLYILNFSLIRLICLFLKKIVHVYLINEWRYFLSKFQSLITNLWCFCWLLLFCLLLDNQLIFFVSCVFFWIIAIICFFLL